MIQIVAVGKVKEPYLIDGINEYQKRLKPYTKLNIIEIDDYTIKNKETPSLIENAKIKEGEAILSKINNNDYVILLDLHGQDYSSEDMAKKIQDLYTYGNTNITFVIAGSYGYSQEVINRANLRWRLSNCTFLHQMVRLMLVEQIYRFYKILGNEPYHK